jgi:hypothetical protein
MRTQSYHAEVLVELFKQKKIATFPELKQALGTAADMTVFRKLRESGYRTSYSHRGKYYALERDMDFDAQGLWVFGPARFSTYGTLLDTACVFVTEADAGFFCEELESVLNVGVKEALLKLFRQERVSRERIFGRYLYCSRDSVVRRRQVMSRRIFERERGVAPGFAGGEAVPDELKAAIILFVSMLGEKQRRLYAGLESLKLGHGGDRKIAELTAMDVHTVARGRRELLSQDVDAERVRKAGGGRKRLEKKRRK